MKVLKIFGESFIILLLIYQAVYCKPEWYETKDGKRFLIENQEEYNWYDAFHECADRNLKLLAIESKEKNNALIEVLVVNFPKINNLWIGGFDKFGEKHDGSRPFYWIDGDVTTGKPFSYIYWAFRQPDNYKRREHCVHIWGHANTFRWNDNSCHKQEFGFICEEKDEKSTKVENLINDKHQDEENESNQRYNTIYSHSDDRKIEDPIQEVVYNIADNNEWSKSLQNIQYKTEVDIFDILSNQKSYRVIRVKK